MENTWALLFLPAIQTEDSGFRSAIITDGTEKDIFL